MNYKYSLYVYNGMSNLYYYDYLILIKISNLFNINITEINNIENMFKLYSPHTFTIIKTKYKHLFKFDENRIIFNKELNIQTLVDETYKVFQVLHFFERIPLSEHIVFLYAYDFDSLIISLVIAKQIDKERINIYLLGEIFLKTKFTNIEFENIFLYVNYISFLKNLYLFFKNIVIEKKYTFKGLFSLDNISNCYLFREHIFSTKDVQNNSLLDLNFTIDKRDSFYYFPIRTSSKCYYGKCEFCYESKFNWTSHIKTITILIDEILYLHKKYKIKKFKFVDSFIHENYLIIFSKEILERNIKITWMASTRFGVKFQSEEFVKIIKKAGCIKLFLGIESYSKKMLMLFNKKIKIESIVPILTNLKRFNIITHVSLLFGYFCESNLDRNKTLEFINNYSHLLDIIEINLFVNNSHKVHNEILMPELKNFVLKLRKKYCQNGTNILNII